MNTSPGPRTEERLLVPADWAHDRPQRLALLRRLFASLHLDAADRRRLRP